MNAADGVQALAAGGRPVAGGAQPLSDHDQRTLLTVQNVHKAYSARSLGDVLRGRPAQRSPALNGVSFQLKAGRVTALLGPNGAGKTTLINVLCDLTRADQGEVIVAGLPIPQAGLAARRLIGYASTNDRSFHWRLSGRYNLEFFAALQGFGRERARALADEMLRRFDLLSHADKFFHTYSAGMKKRLGLARAFLHDPQVLLLDEPTNGLDARSTEELLVMVREQIDVSHKTVLWATHRTEEIERLCDDVIVVIDGCVHFDGGADAFLDISRRHMAFTIDALAPGGGGTAFAALVADLGLRCGPPGPEGNMDLDGVGDENRLSEALARLIAIGVRVRQVARHAEPLHQVFSHLAAQGGRAALGEDGP
jgi:ABC-2 type transport system ATP-binding protein